MAALLTLLSYLATLAVGCALGVLVARHTPSEGQRPNGWVPQGRTEPHPPSPPPGQQDPPPPPPAAVWATYDERKENPRD